MITDDQLEQRLIASRRARLTRSAFTARVMEQVESAATFVPQPRITNVTSKWSPLMRYAQHHKIQAAAAGLAVLASVGFSGYAYATGSNPVELITRIVTGHQVKATLNGHTYLYGTNRSYSDAAISAFAELQTVRDLHMKASNTFMVPKNGIEHLDAGTNANFVYPEVATITRADDSNLYLQTNYRLGDKVTHSDNTGQQIVIPRTTLSYYIKGELATAGRVGQLVVVYQDTFWSHRIGFKEPVTMMTQSFVFELTHSLADIKDADQANRQSPAGSSDNQGLYDPSWGSLSNICLNNGADRCGETGMSNGGQGLYAFREPDIDTKPGPHQFRELGTTHMQTTNNPDVIPFGEMVLDNAHQPAGLIPRNTEGTITKIQGDTITIKSSSGAHWTFTVKAGLVAQFATNWGSPLKVGDKLAANVLASLTDLDNRSFDNAHIYNLQRAR